MNAILPWEVEKLTPGDIIHVELFEGCTEVYGSFDFIYRFCKGKYNPMSFSRFAVYGEILGEGEGEGEGKGKGECDKANIVCVISTFVNDPHFYSNRKWVGDDNFLLRAKMYKVDKKSEQ